MKTSMENQYKAVSALWALLGILFLIGALAMFVMRDNMPQVPRADIAYIGFLLLGAVFLIVAVSVYYMAKDKNAVIQENDERKDDFGKSGEFSVCGSDGSREQCAFFALLHGLCNCACYDCFNVFDCGEHFCVSGFGFLL